MILEKNEMRWRGGNLILAIILNLLEDKLWDSIQTSEDKFSNWTETTQNDPYEQS